MGRRETERKSGIDYGNVTYQPPGKGAECSMNHRCLKSEKGEKKRGCMNKDWGMNNSTYDAYIFLHSVQDPFAVFPRDPLPHGNLFKCMLTIQVFYHPREKMSITHDKPLS